MAKFRKRPIIVEAVQWFANSMCFHVGVWCDGEGPDEGKPYVITSHHQRVYLADGDWIIPDGIDGTFYPCKPDIFEATYEPVAEAPRHDG